MKVRIKRIGKGKRYKNIAYLTKGEVYHAVRRNSWSFDIVNDVGRNLFCLFKGCAHLLGGDWEVVEEGKEVENAAD